MSQQRLWPFQEAQRIIDRWPARDHYIFETGFGASGHPHMGTIGEVMRTYYVSMALADLGKSSEIIVFSDDMDGLRKIPSNIKAPWLKEHLGKPVHTIPDPYGTEASFAHHMNAELQKMMEETGIKTTFKSSHRCYSGGTFNDGIRAMFRKMEEIKEAVLPTMREENRKNWFPWLPICEGCGKIYTTIVHDYDPESLEVSYSCTGQFGSVDGCGYRGKQSALGGRGKFFWKADWALRWYVFKINYEMHGKDLIDSASLSTKLVRIINGQTPVNMVYELFLTEEGRKISKSTGAGISLENWGRWGTQDSLNLLMFKNPKQQKRLSADSIIQYSDECLTMPKEDPQYRFIYYDQDRPDLGGLRYSDLINIVNATSVTDIDQLLEYVRRSFGSQRIDQNRSFVRELLAKAVNYYQDFILPTRQMPQLTEEDWDLVDKFVELVKNEDDGDKLQTQIYEIAKANNRQPKDYFQMLYGVLLGAKSGPRLGGFVKLMGKEKILELIEKAKETTVQ
jgi:lysyl-tRNA synthetase class 1